MKLKNVDWPLSAPVALYARTRTFPPTFERYVRLPAAGRVSPHQPDRQDIIDVDLDVVAGIRQVEREQRSVMAAGSPSAACTSAVSKPVVLLRPPAPMPSVTAPPKPASAPMVVMVPEVVMA